MGTSLKTGKPEILNWFKENEKNITSVLDIGAGSGTYIGLIKEENNVCQDAKWVAIEAWQPYIDKFNLANRYHEVIHDDIKKIDLSILEKFSVAVAGDILEHMSKDDAISVVDNVLNNCDILIISIPIIHMPQDEINGNPFEIHVKDDWSHDEVLHTWKHFIKNFYIKNHRSKIGVYWLAK